MFISADGTKLNVDSGADGVPVVFQHGLCGDAGQTADVFPADIGFCRTTVEARGHGRSEPGPVDRLSIAAFTDDVAAFIEQRLDAPIVAGGISMGAAMSLRLAVKRPHLVSGLILARPAWVTAPAPANMRPNAEVSRLLQKMPAAVAREVFSDGETARRLAVEAPDNLASLLGFFSREPIDVTAALLGSIAADGPGVTDEEVRELNIPTLVIGHERDSVHPLAHAETLASMIANARLEVITPKAEDRARHRDDFRRVITAFLRAYAP